MVYKRGQGILPESIFVFQILWKHRTDRSKSVSYMSYIIIIEIRNFQKS